MTTDTFEAAWTLDSSCQSLLVDERVARERWRRLLPAGIVLGIDLAALVAAVLLSSLGSVERVGFVVVCLLTLLVTARIATNWSSACSTSFRDCSSLSSSPPSR